MYISTFGIFGWYIQPPHHQHSDYCFKMDTWVKVLLVLLVTPQQGLISFTLGTLLLCKQCRATLYLFMTPISLSDTEAWQLYIAGKLDSLCLWMSPFGCDKLSISDNVGMWMEWLYLTSYILYLDCKKLLQCADGYYSFQTFKYFKSAITSWLNVQEYLMLTAVYVFRKTTWNVNVNRTSLSGSSRYLLARRAELCLDRTNGGSTLQLMGQQLVNSWLSAITQMSELLVFSPSSTLWLIGQNVFISFHNWTAVFAFCTCCLLHSWNVFNDGKVFGNRFSFVFMHCNSLHPFSQRIGTVSFGFHLWFLLERGGRSCHTPLHLQTHKWNDLCDRCLCAFHVELL